MQEFYKAFLEEHRVTRMQELAVANGITKEKIERAVRDGKAASLVKRF